MDVGSQGHGKARERGTAGVVHLQVGAQDFLPDVVKVIALGQLGKKIVRLGCVEHLTLAGAEPGFVDGPGFADGTDNCINGDAPTSFVGSNAALLDSDFVSKFGLI